MPEKIILVVDNVHTRILGRYPHQAVDEATSFLMPGCWFTLAYRAKRWDGKIRLLDRKTSSFPTGLLGDVEKILKHEGYYYIIDDSNLIRKPYFQYRDPERKVELRGIKLRGYQRDAMQKAEHQVRGILDIASGGGKTEIAIGLIKELGVKTLYLVHRLDLMKQTRQRFHDRLGIETGQIGADIFDPKGYYHRHGGDPICPAYFVQDERFPQVHGVYNRR